MLDSFEAGGLAVVVGASGGLGSALADEIAASGRFADVVRLSRRETGLDVTDEESIAAAAETIKARGLPVRLVVVATGLLHWDGVGPEKSWRQLNTDTLLKSYAVNAIGPALVAKHFLPLLPREGKAVFGAISARVGSIEDNKLGGWYGYRAAKAGLNQLIRSAAIEMARGRPQAVCVVLHPGTVQTALSEPFRGPGHEGEPADVAAAKLVAVIDGLQPSANGGFFDQDGLRIPF
jgi:NAD(P)-dependent dehydrogenase (short-subunit alcohol dehydrogenase family)